MIVFSDLDGTLIHRGGQISVANLMAIEILNRMKIRLVMVTGRNMFSLEKSGININLFDYIVFSTGYGIMNRSKKSIYYNNHLTAPDISCIRKVIEDMGLGYMIMKAGADNHMFFMNNPEKNPEMEKRKINYNGCEVDYYEIENQASQFLIIFKYNASMIDYIRQALKGYSVVYSFSPYISDFCWLEIFSGHVSKSSAARMICDWEDTAMEDCLAIGNDFNDYDLLNNAGCAYLVRDCNPDLKGKFRETGESFNDGFSEAVQSWLKEIVAKR